eukprot:gene23003-biopygen8821
MVRRSQQTSVHNLLQRRSATKLGRALKAPEKRWCTWLQAFSQHVVRPGMQAALVTGSGGSSNARAQRAQGRKHFDSPTRPELTEPLLPPRESQCPPPGASPRCRARRRCQRATRGTARILRNIVCVESGSCHNGVRARWRRARSAPLAPRYM